MNIKAVASEAASDIDTLLERPDPTPGEAKSRASLGMNEIADKFPVNTDEK